MAKVISTMDIPETLTTGKDKHYEINNNDEPLKVIDQSKTCSTRTIIPSKRQVSKKDIKKFVTKMKKVEVKKDKVKVEKKRGRKTKLKDK